MSSSANATEVERNAAEKEKASGDKPETLKRPASEVNDAGDETKQKVQKTGKEKENGEPVNKDDDGDDDDSRDYDEEVGAEGDDYDEEEGDEDGADDDAEDDEEDDV